MYKESVDEAIHLLKELIKIPSRSRGETAATNCLENFMHHKDLKTTRLGNNLICKSENWNEQRPTLLLNAHIDTVKAAESWKRAPFIPTLEGEKLYGLGSNDDGGSLVSLLQSFRILISKDNKEHPLPYNLIYVASCEEEVSGKNGMELVLPSLPHIDVALVGEPTGLQPAIAEKGLMVIDAVAEGITGHAAREEGVNAIYVALDDITWIRSHKFEKTSPLLGDVKATVTIINAGNQHNVIPDRCIFTIDVRSNENYKNQEIFKILKEALKSKLNAHSFRLNSSRINLDHPLIKKLVLLHRKPFGSPTLSDQSLMPFPSFKMGPGESSRSHTADEFIKISEIEEAINLYCQLLS